MNQSGQSFEQPPHELGVSDPLAARAEKIYADLIGNLDPRVDPADPGVQHVFGVTAETLAKSELTGNPGDKDDVNRQTLIELTAGGMPGHILDTFMKTRELAPLTPAESQQVESMKVKHQEARQAFEAIQDNMAALLSEYGLEPTDENMPYLEMLMQYDLQLRYQTPGSDIAQARAQALEQSLEVLPEELKPLARQLFGN